MENYLIAAVLGIIEGLTEFLPVSSTGHLIVFGDFLGFQGPAGKTFEIMIQLGAILALIVVYWRKVFGTVIGLPVDPKARRFALTILIGFLPAMVLGALLADRIEALLDSPTVVAVALILGGIVMLAVEQLRHRPRYGMVEEVPYLTSLLIGFAQTCAMVPGVSRSGATIIGGLLLGLERRTAAEFSFFLAMPTMAAAFTYSAFKHRADLDFHDFGLIATGFVMAFLAALLVVKPFLAIVSRIGFSPFAYYRVALGTLVLVLLYM
ncbi:MAG: undecaprenyl-diphosphate phosphatase [Hyphomicrobiaceae bacterium]